MDADNRLCSKSRPRATWLSITKTHLGGVELVEDEVQQRRLARAVVPHDPCTNIMHMCAVVGIQFHKRERETDVGSFAAFPVGTHKRTRPPYVPILVSKSTPKSTSFSKICPISAGGFGAAGASPATAEASPPSPLAPSAAVAAGAGAAVKSRLGYPKLTRWMLMTGRPKGSGTGRWNAKAES